MQIQLPPTLNTLVTSLKNNLFRLSCKLAKHEAGGRYSPLFPLHLNNKTEDTQRERKQCFPIMPEVVFMRGYNCVQQCAKKEQFECFYVLVHGLVPLSCLITRMLPQQAGGCVKGFTYH